VQYVESSSGVEGRRGILINMKVLQSQEIIFRERMLWFQLFRTDI
jgi:hypothetical protein